MNINETLKHYFGYDSLRPGQQELIEGILQRKDVLGIMPTGAGKSLCYQVPALMLDGITIVVSPLISLMTDQVKALNQAGVHAAYINSSLTENQIRTALFYAAQGRYKIIYVAPERLNTIRFLEFACQVDISMVTVDEAHCISQWGQDFRPSYVGIADFLAQLPKRPVVSAFTATATERVKQDIMGSLRLQNPVTVVTGFDRPNLFFRVVTRKGGKETDNSVLNYVKKHEDESGIIYCATKKNADKIYGLLQQYGIEAGHYHAGLSLEERKKNQDDFTYDRIRVMVATNAFGMGVQKIQSYGEHFTKIIIDFLEEQSAAGGADAETLQLTTELTPEQIEETTGITVAASPAREKKLPFYIAPGKLDEVELTDTCMISELTNRINELCDEEDQKNRKKLTAAFVNTLLIQKGYIEEATEGEEKVKHITEKGKEAGIQEEERYGKYGRKYYALVHTRESQEMILGELREYLADLTDE